ncbi:MAG TPA: hypothetical protein VIH34_02470, partial [Candidatus Bathyarchaeia archaeon]
MGEDENRTFKPRLEHLYPVILSLAITGILGIPFAVNDIEVTAVTPFEGTTYSGASLNALVFVVALAISATAMFLLVRRGKTGFLRKMIKSAIVIVCFSVVLWYATTLFFPPGSPIAEPVALVILLGGSTASALGLGL